MESLARVRREFAAKIAAAATLRSAALLHALEAVPREAFLGPGPWQILRLTEPGRGYVLTPDDDPRWLYDNVLVALDPERLLNNGEPVALLRWLDQLELVPGERFLHVGCGVGYYTAIAAEALAGGAVVAVELDPRLAERARRTLAHWPNVTVGCRDGSELGDGGFDAIFVNAGATEPLPCWLDALAPGGRLLLPLTVGLPRGEIGAGHMLRVVREAEAWPARFVSPVGIFHCTGARTREGEMLLRRAYERGGEERVRSLLRDGHAPEPRCWLHAFRFCLSERDGGAGRLIAAPHRSRAEPGGRAPLEPLACRPPGARSGIEWSLMTSRHLQVFLFVLASCVGCDHAAKQVAEELLAGSRGFALAGGLVHFQLVSNPGAFLSLGAGLPEAVRQLLWIGLVPLALGLVSWLVWRSPRASHAQLLALGLVAGGGLANWLDRVLHDGAVTDFVSLGVGRLRTGIFNVADVAIVAGVLLLLRSGAASGAESDDG